MDNLTQPWKRLILRSFAILWLQPWWRHSGNGVSLNKPTVKLAKLAAILSGKQPPKKVPNLMRNFLKLELSRVSMQVFRFDVGIHSSTHLMHLANEFDARLSHPFHLPVSPLFSEFVAAANLLLEFVC